MSPMEQLRSMLWRLAALFLGLLAGVVLAAALLPHRTH